jgi:formate--tetrahydrofolate ligase
MPAAGLQPSVAVIICSVRSVLRHGGKTASTLPLTAGFKPGLENLAKHVDTLRKFRVPVVAAINHFASDTAEQIEALNAFCRELGITSALSDVYEQGGGGGTDLAEKVMSAADAASPDNVRTLYPAEMTLNQKIETVAREVYGAARVVCEPAACKKLEKFTKLGYGHLPVCMAKTQASLTDNPNTLGAPCNWTLTVRDVALSAGAGFVVAVTGEMMLMPGLGKSPQAFRLDVDDTTGAIQGMM